MRNRRVSACLCAGLVALLLMGALSLLIPSLPASGAGTPPPAPFLFAVDKSSIGQLSGMGGNQLTVRRDTHLPRGEALTLNGWVSTERGISAYQFIWVPTGGAPAAWQTVQNATIAARPDLTNANIPYPNGHKTAGFALTVPPPADAADGYYDVFIRALDGDGAPCDFLALVHLRYGNADPDNRTSRRISFARLMEEAAADPSVLRGDATVTGEGIRLAVGGRVRLGEFDLAGFESVTLTYQTVSGQPLRSEPRGTMLALSAAGDHAIGTGDDKYNMTDVLTYALPTEAAGKLTLPLTDIRHAGAVWLTGHLSEAVLITSVEFTYTGNGSDRVAARIHLSEALLGNHFAGANAVNLSGVRDPLLGDVLRIEVAQDTNDPYVHFYAEQVLEAAGIRLSADEYRYMVVLARAMPHNAGRHMAFYLCAGTIIGATGDCTHSTLLENDGEWHYYLLDLTQVELWKGVIHGWRFDIINGNCHAGDAVEYASVQFFRTQEAAEAAAARPVSEATPYTVGDAVVYPDMVEEQSGGESVDPADTYVETTSETVWETTSETTPEALPETLPETTPEAEGSVPESNETAPEAAPESIPESLSPADTSAIPESSTESDDSPAPPKSRGCSSALPAALVLWPLWTGAVWCLLRRKS